MKYYYFGHHKCASSWIWAILAQLCREAGLRHKIILDPLTPSGHGPLTDYRNPAIHRDALGEYIESQHYDFISLITADRQQVEAIGHPFRGFHVIRDPRDIIVSAYFSHRNSHPTDDLPHLAAHREQLKGLSKHEGILAEMEFSGRELRDMAAWDYDREEIMEIKMEDLVARPYDTFLEIFEFLDLIEWDGHYIMRDRVQTFLKIVRNRLSSRGGIWSGLRTPMQVTGEMLLGRVYDNRFAKKAGGRKSGDENVNSHYRKGKAGDWRRHFTPEHVDFFSEQFGDVLQKLGYETTPNWSSQLIAS